MPKFGSTGQIDQFVDMFVRRAQDCYISIISHFGGGQV